LDFAVPGVDGQIAAAADIAGVVAVPVVDIVEAEAVPVVDIVEEAEEEAEAAVPESLVREPENKRDMYRIQSFVFRNLYKKP